MSSPHPDLPDIAALHHGAPARIDRIAHLLHNGAGLVTYRTEGVLRGYLLWQPGAGGIVETSLYVAPGWRRRGIEARLRRRLPQPTDAP
ncbi:hypothetical protein [Marinovum sp.]|uniref:hypothetical protein n=1 Tax=Marinovum sp. TaxID=2024839 RepID=UPI003A941BBA